MELSRRRIPGTSIAAGEQIVVRQCEFGEALRVFGPNMLDVACKLGNPFGAIATQGALGPDQETMELWLFGLLQSAP
jgi:hypothetical protein